MELCEAAGTGSERARVVPSRLRAGGGAACGKPHEDGVAERERELYAPAKGHGQTSGWTAARFPVGQPSVHPIIEPGEIPHGATAFRSGDVHSIEAEQVGLRRLAFIR
jgi:hypothetical protein